MAAYESPKTWDPQEVKRSIDMQLNFDDPDLPVDTRNEPTALARAKAKAAVPVAMDSIIYLATYSENESIRLKSATYLIDRVFGRVTDMPMDASMVDDSDPLTQLVKKAMSSGAN